MPNINLFQPFVHDDAKRAVAAVLDTRWIGQGPRVDEFERLFRERFAPPGYDAVATSSCTAALHLAYLLAGIELGDEVIAPLFTCTATNMPLLWLGAKIRFCDVEPGGLNMDHAHLRKLREDGDTKAIVTVNYGGKPCTAAPFFDPHIEDCAQSIGSSSGTLARYRCYSFQAVKHVTTGDGGMLVLPVDQAEKARRMRWFGIDRRAKLGGVWANQIYEVGYKYQMTDIAAAMGIVGISGEHLTHQIEHRRFLRNRYVEALPLDVTVIDLDCDSACWLMTVLVDDREGLKRKLAECGIESDPVHYRNDRYAIFGDGVVPGRYPNMDGIESRYLCLPMHMYVTAEDVERICSVIAEGW